MQSDRTGSRFFVLMAAAAAITVFAGFARSYYLKTAFNSPSLPTLVHLHGVVFTAWIVFFISQILLVTTGRVRIHRTMGILGIALALLMLAIGSATALEGAKRGFVPAGTGSDPLGGIAIVMSGLLLFAIFVAAGFVFRRQPDIHKRLMLLATINLMPPAISRIWPAGIPLVFLLFVIAGPIYDRVSGRRLSSAYLWGGLVSLIVFIGSVPVGATNAWHSFAAWLTR